jgi:hypothetical protein
MPMKVTARFNGDVVIYDKNGLWNFVFITDQDHIVELSANGSSVTSGRGLRRPGVNRHLFLLPDQAVGSGRRRGTNFGDILNANEIHGVDSAGNSNLLAYQASPGNRELMHLSIPLGTVDAGPDVVCDYWFESYPNGTRICRGRRTAQTVVLSFSLRGGLTLVMSDNGGTSSIPWPNTSSPLDLHFDNDCHQGHSGREDFLNYYDWIHDKRSSSSRYLAGKVICKTLKNGKTRRSPEGNCDPVVIDPEIGG